MYTSNCFHSLTDKVLVFGTSDGGSIPPGSTVKVTKYFFALLLQCKHLMNWYVYIVKCKDDSLYTGITTNLERRLLQHNTDNLKGAKSLRGKRPVQLVYKEEYQTQTEARKREVAIKNWKRKYKLKLINKSKVSGFTL